MASDARSRFPAEVEALTGAPEYFVTGIEIEREPGGLVRLVFYTGGTAVSVVMQPDDYDAMAARLAMGPARRRVN